MGVAAEIIQSRFREPMGSRARLEGSGGDSQKTGRGFALSGSFALKRGPKAHRKRRASWVPECRSRPGGGGGNICRAPVPAGTLTAPALVQRARSPPWGETPNRTEAQPAPRWDPKRHAPRWPSDTPSPHSSPRRTTRAAGRHSSQTQLEAAGRDMNEESAA